MPDFGPGFSRLAQDAFHGADGCRRAEADRLIEDDPAVEHLLPRKRKAELPRLAFPQPFEKMAAAERDITVVAADFGLGSGGDCVAFGVDTQVHGCLASAV